MFKKEKMEDKEREMRVVTWKKNEEKEGKGKWNAKKKKMREALKETEWKG